MKTCNTSIVNYFFIRYKYYFFKWLWWYSFEIKWLCWYT